MYTWLSLSDVKAVYPTSYDENMNEEAIDTLVRSLKGYVMFGILNRGSKLTKKAAGVE